MSIYHFALLYALANFVGQGNSRLLQAVEGPATSPQSESLGQKCSSTCNSPVLFRALSPTQSISYACAASTPAGVVVGFQLSTGPATCTVTDGEQSLSSINFTCMCLESGETQGLDLPGKSGTCSDSCSSSVDGTVGLPKQSSGSYTCLATTEIGVTNRFGTVKNNACTFTAADNTTKSSSQFSCVCAFSAAKAASSATGQAAQQIVATATAG